MSRASNALVLMDLPDGPGRSALRAALMALRVAPVDLPADPQAWDGAFRRLAKAPCGMAFIDISHDGQAAMSRLLVLDKHLPRSLRERIVLTRLQAGPGMGHVSEGDRRWVKQLGFADLLADFDATECEGSLRTAIDAVARQIKASPLSPAELARYARVMNSERETTSPRAVIRGRFGMSAEALAEALGDTLDIVDRSWRMKSYAMCFAGSDAVEAMARRCKCSRAEAVAVGQSLMSLGLLVHVVHEHPFLDDNLYYRLATSKTADAVDLAQALTRLTGPDGPPTADRSHLGKTYERCWIGAEAVDRLVQWHGIARHDAWIVLPRLMQFGLVAHVAQARRVIDGHFFYRFTGLPADGVR